MFNWPYGEGCGARMRKITRRHAAQVMGGATASLALEAPGNRAIAQRSKPNIILIVVDDLRWDEFGAAGHPYLETPNIDRIAHDGAMFTQAIHAVPLCSPNRATILTGQYPSRHGIIGNEARDHLSHRLLTFPRTLQKAGYRTGHIGKWHMGNDPTPRPGYDHWISFPGQGKIIDPELFENGKLQKTSGYVTELLNDRAVAFIKASANQDKPFFLCLAHKAIHPDLIQRNDGSIDLAYGSRFIPAERHKGAYKDKIFPRRRNYVSPMKIMAGNAMMRHLLESKNSPELIAKYGQVADLSTSEQTIREREEMLLSIEDGVGAIFETLKAANVLDNTVIMFTSDNGYFYGEHGLSVERRMPYEEAVLAPLLVRHPPQVKAQSKIKSIVSSVDIAPTLLELAGAPIGSHIQGRSFLGLLKGDRSGGRTSAYMEYYGDEVFEWTDDADYRAIRTDTHKYIHWVQHPEFDELYDLTADPFEVTNLIDRPEQRQLLMGLRARLGKQVLFALGLDDAVGNR